MTQCVLLNADYTFLNLVNWKRAVCLMAKGKVEVVKDSPRTIRNCSGEVTTIEVRAPVRRTGRTSPCWTKRLPWT